MERGRLLHCVIKYTLIGFIFICRYTECRLQPFASAAMLADLGLDTVSMLPNFDNSVVCTLLLPFLGVLNDY